MAELQKTLPKAIGKQIAGLWHEYNQCASQEAKFVKALDKIETLTQLTESGHKTYDKPELIPNYADKSVKLFPELLNMLKIIKKKLKSEFHQGGIKWKKRI